MPLSRVLVLIQIAFVGFEWLMYCIVRHVQIERFSFLDGSGHLCLGFDGQGIGQEDIASVVFLQSRYGSRFVSFDVSIAPLAIIASRLADGITTDVHIEAYVPRVFSFATDASVVRLSYLNGAITGFLQELGVDRHLTGQSFPIPFVGTVSGAVVAFGVNPVGSAMAGRILSGHDGSA